jgi:hypothetical protein
MGGGGGQNQKRNLFPEKNLGEKNLPRHSAKKKIPCLEDKPINFTLKKYFQPSIEKKKILL